MKKTLFAELPEYLLARGEHAGFAWVVARNDYAARCGYVLIPAGHPWFGKDYDTIGCDVHGGLTWSSLEPDGNWWIGFDCFHAGDAADPNLPSKIPRMPPHLFGDHVWTQEEVEAECRKLCEQAAAAAK